MMKEPVQLSAQQLVIGTLTVVLSFLWYMSSFLTLKEHQEFVTRFNSDIIRIESEEQRQNREMMTRREFEAWKSERDKMIASMQDRQNRFSEALDSLYSKITTQPPSYK